MMKKFKVLKLKETYERILKLNKLLKEYFMNYKWKKSQNKSGAHASKMSQYDELTKLPNNKYFFRKFNDVLEKAKSTNKKGAVIYIDIDNYKIINNSWGYKLGDIILKKFSSLINSCLGKNAELIRLNGDEFIILLSEINEMIEIDEVCSKIYKKLEEPHKIRDAEIKINISMGIAVFPDNSTEPEELLKFCDFAMYRSKNRGKNTYTIFNSEMSDAYYREILIKHELKNAINKDEFSIFYQPQINALDNKIVGIEALIRWNNDKLGNVSPAEFIPIAEESGDIIEIGDWVFDKALSQIQAWKHKDYVFDTISVNVSPIQIKKKDFKEKLLDVCIKYDIKPSCLEIEITEGTLMDISKENIDKLNEIIANGIKVAIDDFGTGYSSLNYLVNIPVSTLKIDKTFVDNISDYKNKVLVKSIVNLAQLFKYRIITEGVETKEQIESLKDLGCNIIQGYYFSKPLPINKIEGLLKAMSYK